MTAKRAVGFACISRTDLGTMVSGLVLENNPEDSRGGTQKQCRLELSGKST